jgi:hypothetical protein
MLAWDDEDTVTMPSKRKQLDSSWTRTTRPRISSVADAAPPPSLGSGATPRNAPLISPTPPTRLRTDPRTHRMPTTNTFKHYRPTQQNAPPVRPQPQSPPASTRGRRFQAAEYSPLQQGQAIIIDHRSQSEAASQSASQKRWLEDATRNVRMPTQVNRLKDVARVSQPPQPYQPKTQPIACKPQVLHAPHPNSKILQDFHWVPYPLGLLPYDSWHRLHNGPEVFPPLPFRCPVCAKERKVTAHLRKTYLVAERLSWEDEFVSAPDRNSNEELNWAVNYELGIMEPFVEDAEQVPGGKLSQKHKFHPFRNEFEMEQALNLIFTAENITDASWNLWVGLQTDLQRFTGNEEMQSSNPSATSAPQSERMARLPEISANSRPKTPPATIEEIDLTSSSQPPPELAVKDPAPPLPTPPSSLLATDITRVWLPDNAQTSLALPVTNRTDEENPSQNRQAVRSSTDRRIVSYRTRQDFYSLLDRIERTSYVGALFLEAYAERLRDDMCKDCWFKRYVEDAL